ncbi:MAG: tetratricopeptide repeat protein [Promethearchaeota archaeon]
MTLYRANHQNREGQIRSSILELFIKHLIGKKSLKDLLNWNDFIADYHCGKIAFEETHFDEDLKYIENKFWAHLKHNIFPKIKPNIPIKHLPNKEECAKKDKYDNGNNEFATINDNLAPESESSSNISDKDNLKNIFFIKGPPTSGKNAILKKLRDTMRQFNKHAENSINNSNNNYDESIISEYKNYVIPNYSYIFLQLDQNIRNIIINNTLSIFIGLFKMVLEHFSLIIRTLYEENNICVDNPIEVFKITSDINYYKNLMAQHIQNKFENLTSGRISIEVFYAHLHNYLKDINYYLRIHDHFLVIAINDIHYTSNLAISEYNSYESPYNYNFMKNLHEFIQGFSLNNYSNIKLVLTFRIDNFDPLNKKVLNDFESDIINLKNMQSASIIELSYSVSENPNDVLDYINQICQYNFGGLQFEDVGALKKLFSLVNENIHQFNLILNVLKYNNVEFIDSNNIDNIISNLLNNNTPHLQNYFNSIKNSIVNLNYQNKIAGPMLWRFIKTLAKYYRRYPKNTIFCLFKTIWKIYEGNQQIPEDVINSFERFLNYNNLINKTIITKNKPQNNLEYAANSENFYTPNIIAYSIYNEFFSRLINIYDTYEYSIEKIFAGIIDPILAYCISKDSGSNTIDLNLLDIINKFVINNGTNNIANNNLVNYLPEIQKDDYITLFYRLLSYGKSYEKDFNMKAAGKYYESCFGILSNRLGYNSIFGLQEEEIVKTNISDLIKNISEKGSSIQINDFMDFLLNYAIYNMEYGDAELALKLLGIDEKLAREKEDKKLLSACLGNMGLIYNDKGEPDKALEYHQKAYKIHEELGNKRGMASQLENMGNIYASKGEPDKTLELYQKAYKIHEELGNKRGMAAHLGNMGLIYYLKGMAQDLGNMGNIYYLKGELDKALEYHQKAYKIDEELGNKRGMAQGLGNMGNIYYLKGEPDKALEYHQKAYKIDEELGNKLGMAQDLGNMGNIYNRKGYPDKALEYHQKAYEIDEELGNKRGMAAHLGNMGNIYLKQGQKAKALESFTGCYILSFISQYDIGIRFAIQHLQEFFDSPQQLKQFLELRLKKFFNNQNG